MDTPIGMEIRVAVTAYVADRIAAARQAQANLSSDSPEKLKGGFENVSVIRANSMKHMPNFFFKGQVRRLSFYTRLKILIREWYAS